MPTENTELAATYSIAMPHKVGAHAIAHKHWDYLRGQIEKCKCKLSPLQSALWASIGIAVSSLAGAIALAEPARDAALGGTDTTSGMSLAAAVHWVCFGAAFIAILALLAFLRMSKQESDDRVSDVVELMAALPATAEVHDEPR